MPDDKYKMADGASVWTVDDARSCMIKIPCQSCGKIVEVWAVGGIYSGCVFCSDCTNGQGTYQYREQF